MLELWYSTWISLVTQLLCTDCRTSLLLFPHSFYIPTVFCLTPNEKINLCKSRDHSALISSRYNPILRSCVLDWTSNGVKRLNYNFIWLIDSTREQEMGRMTTSNGKAEENYIFVNRKVQRGYRRISFGSNAALFINVIVLGRLQVTERQFTVNKKIGSSIWRIKFQSNTIYIT